jgi:chemotaxis protein methyltransferase CheR
MEQLKLSDSEFQRIQALAMRLAGISIPSNKKALVMGRWGRRLAHHGLDTFGEYLDLLGSKRAGNELEISLDLLTTNETNFFREPKHFEFLRKQILPKAARGATFRAWSAACSSGEEPYTLAMVLADFFGSSGWEVVGTDISTRVLKTARAGLYDMPRGAPIPVDFMRRFCMKGVGPQDGKFLVDPEVRKRVRFAHANLNEPLPDLGQFDVILLRNVMIYFDAPTKERVLRHLMPALKPGGHFMIGHCDSLTGVRNPLELVSSSIFRKPPK